MIAAVEVRNAALPRESGGIVELNDGAVPAVNALGETGLDQLARIGGVRVAVDNSSGLLGFVVTLGPDLPYDSLNYAWFSARFDNFLYIDRVVVADCAQGRGVGRLLYEDVIWQARREGRRRVLAEVNVDPPNPVSLAFHASLGFQNVAERLNEREGKVVAMMVRPL